MTEILVIKEETCSDCRGKGQVPQIGRSGKPTFPGRYEMCISCLGKGTVRAEVSLLDPEIRTALLEAMGPALARLLDMPEQAISSANGATPRLLAPTANS